MEFEDLIELVRDSYVSQFSQFMDEQTKAFSHGSGEVKLVLSEDSGFYRRYYCADYVASGDDGTVVELTADEEITFSPVSVSLGDLDMQVERLVWSDVNLKLEDGMYDPSDFSAWFETWFDPDELVFDPDTRFSGRIHALTVDKDGLHIDLGTAPTDALVALLVLLEGLGHKTVKLT